MIPRRGSVDGSTPPRIPPFVGERLQISLDGDVKRNVVAYDMDYGWLILVPTDDHGTFLVDDNGEFLQALLWGKVEVISG